MYTKKVIFSRINPSQNDLLQDIETITHYHVYKELVGFYYATLTLKKICRFKSSFILLLIKFLN